MTDVQVLSMLFCFGFENGAAKQQLQKWELKFVTELEPLEGASPVYIYVSIQICHIAYTANRKSHGKEMKKRHPNGTPRHEQVTAKLLQSPLSLDASARHKRHGAIFAPNLPLDQDLVLKTPMVTTGDPS